MSDNPIQLVRKHLATKGWTVEEFGSLEHSLPQAILRFNGADLRPGKGPRWQVEILLICADLDTPDPTDVIVDTTQKMWEDLADLPRWVRDDVSGQQIIDDPLFVWEDLMFGSTVAISQR